MAVSKKKQLDEGPKPKLNPINPHLLTRRTDTNSMFKEFPRLTKIEGKLQEVVYAKKKLFAQINNRFFDISQVPLFKQYIDVSEYDDMKVLIPNTFEHQLTSLEKLQFGSNQYGNC